MSQRYFNTYITSILHFQFSPATDKLYAARNKVVSLKVVTVPNPDHNSREPARNNKENLATDYSQLKNRYLLEDQKKLWLRILLLYGSNQHFVKPVTVCQQHLGEKFPGKTDLLESAKICKANGPIDLSKSFSNTSQNGDKELCLVKSCILIYYLKELPEK